MNPFDSMEPLDPGNADIILGAQLFNSHKRKPLTIISGEFKELNGKVIQPRTELNINLNIPAGYREYINETFFKGKYYIYVGLCDKDQAEPFVYKPTL